MSCTPNLLSETPDDQLIWQELQQESIRWLIYLQGAVGVGVVLINEARRGPNSVNLTGLLIIFFAGACLLLLRWRYRAAAYALWVGWMGLIVYERIVGDNTGWMALLALPVGLATLLLTPWLGLAVMLAASLLLPWANAGEARWAQELLLAPAWATLALLWIFIHAARRAMRWSWLGFQKACTLLEEARERQGELEEVRQDLVEANQQLTRMSKRLDALYQVAEEARQAKARFVANVSHELRTPLNMILGFSEMITQAPQVYAANLPPALLADIATIQRNSQHLAGLVNDVLDLSQAEAGYTALSKQWVQLADVVQAAVIAVQPLFQGKGLQLCVKLDPALPMLYCDETRIRQVILNLLSNAGRFTDVGGVRIGANSDGHTVTLWVADSGPGIPADKQALVFEPFQQLDSSLRRRTEGSGLGLSISRQFVEMHGGKMWLESEVGAGSTVFVRLPIATAGDPENAGAAQRWFNPHQPYEERTRRFKAPLPILKPRYVVLEPGDTLCNLLHHHLADAELAAVKCIEEAGDELARAPANALLVNDPLLSQEDASASRLGSLPFGTPALLCWLPGLEEVCQRLGIVHYLVKPVTRQELLAALDDLGGAIQTILLVDDEPEALQLFARMLAASPRRYRVLRADNGQRALDLLRQRKPDAVVLDLIMPELDGFAVLRAMGADPMLRTIPTVVLSSQDPTGAPVVSNRVTITKSGGLSVRDLITCIGLVTRELVVEAGPQPNLNRQPS